MRLYQLLLHLYPASFRNEYGSEMSAVFARRLRDAGFFGRAFVWLEALADAVINASLAHFELASQDVRYSVRLLLRTPAFTFTAIVVSALGIGATTAAFSITDHVLIRPLPFKDPDRLVRLYQDNSERGYTRLELSPPNYYDWQRMATGFETMGAFTNTSVNLVGDGEPERLTAFRVTHEVLPMLGVAPAIGRVFTPQEDNADVPGTVILSSALWQERFGSDPNIIGRKILLNDEPHLVIGVMPRTFYFPRREAQLWVPMRMPNDDDRTDRRNYFLYGVARLKDGVSVDEARAQLRLVAAQLERQYPVENAHQGATVVDLRTDLSTQIRLLLAALFGAAACVLLIACTNLGNLLLARSLARRRELAVRTALGAGRERIVRQLLTESLLLASVGGVLGVAIAVAAMALAVRLVPNSLPLAEVPPFDARMLVVAIVVTVTTALGFGVFPALRAGRLDPGALAEGSRTGSGRHTERVRSLLVVAEVTASVVLLISAGLLIRALWTVQQVNPGFDAGNVLTMRTTLPRPKYDPTDARTRFYNRVVSEARALPGVTHAAYITSVPMGWMRGGIWPITMDGRRESEANAPTASIRFVTPGFFSALRIPLHAGRDVDERDTFKSPFVAVVSESFAREHWPGQSPLGRRFFVAFRERTVVGVVADVHVRGLERKSEPQVYMPHQQIPDGGLSGYAPQDLVVRSTTSPIALVPSLRAIIAGADPRQPISDIRLMQDAVDTETAPRTAQLRVLGAFAALALFLAGVGLHGVLAFIVSTKFREIGVRIALGAASRDIAAMIVRQGLGLAAAGAVIGIVIAYVAGRAMQSLLAGVSPTDTLAYGAAVGLVLVVTVAGTLAPAIRAMRIDPLVAIRTE
jgi:putative ABC transport system permease protein